MEISLTKNIIKP